MLTPLRGQLGPLGVAQKRLLTYQQKLMGIQSASLIAYWPFTESVGTTAADVSGNSRNGTYVNGPLLANTPGPGSSMGSAPKFDAINDYVNVFSAGLAAAVNENEGSAAMWLKVVNVGVWTDASIRLGWYMTSGADTDRLVCIGKSNANNTVLVFRTVGGTTVTINVACSSIDWFHLAQTWSLSGNFIKAYLNGVPTSLSGITSYTAAIGDSTLASYRGTALYWSGWIQHAAIWSKALTDSEMLAVATAQ